MKRLNIYFKSELSPNQEAFKKLVAEIEAFKNAYNITELVIERKDSDLIPGVKDRDQDLTVRVVKTQDFISVTQSKIDTSRIT